MKAAAPATNLKAMNIPTFTDPAMMAPEMMARMAG
jgi:hypothetical protein